MVDKCTREIRKMDTLCRLIRDRGMVPGLSPFNYMGYLMQLEVDWVGKIIQKAKKPAMTTKTMATGQLRPYQWWP
jgi:hypothetical protein